MCSLEWAIKDGVPYAIDFMNPAPDMDLYSLTPHYFEWAVRHMADMAIRLAKEPRRPLDIRRGEFLLGRRDGADLRAEVETPRAVSVESDVEVPARVADAARL
jgi:hypothetical protein